jgi:hypothetical protein
MPARQNSTWFQAAELAKILIQTESEQAFNQNSGCIL